MEDTQAQDVSSAEAETAGGSSPQEQTPQETSKENVDTPSEGTAKQTDYVPYDRFKEKVQEVNELKEAVSKIQERYQTPETPLQPADPQRELIKQEFKKVADELGYVSKEQLQQQKEDEAVQQQLQALEKQYDGSDGRPKFDRKEIVQYALQNRIGNLEAAYNQMHQKDLINWHIAQATQKASGVKTERSDGTGAEGGSSNNDLLDAYRKGDDNAFKQFVRRTKIGKSLIK